MWTYEHSMETEAAPETIWRLWADVENWGKLRTIHRLDRGERLRTRVVYRMEITGPAADELGPGIGPAVTADWPATMAALVESARG